MPDSQKNPFVVLDLRKITRNAKRCLTLVSVSSCARWYPWIVAGECSLHQVQHDHTELIARIDATDVEHDSAYAMILPLTEIKSIRLNNGITSFESTIAHVREWDDEDFRFHIPPPDYDPAKMAGSTVCPGGEYCSFGHKHRIVPSGFYVPAFNKELFWFMVGRRVEVRTGPANVMVMATHS